MARAAGRALALALLTAANASFLWMFLSTDPLEQMAAQIQATRGLPAADPLQFAAAWRHGMAGNSWVFMPGFFVTAAAVWLHARRAASGLAHPERFAAGVVALICAVAGAPAGAATVVDAFAEASNIALAHPVPSVSGIGAFRAAYTLVTWSVFVLACRRALLERAVRPFVAPGVLTVGLAVIRPWTVDDFVSHWLAGVASGEAVAVVSLTLAFLVAALLAASERRSPQPQPGQAALHGTGSSRPEDQKHVSGRRDEVETG